jgi:hypothetical protein
MATIMLRRLPADLAARIKAYADTHEIGRGEACVRLIAYALDTIAERARGAETLQALNTSRTPAERSEASRRAAALRWARARGEE